MTRSTMLLAALTLTVGACEMSGDEPAPYSPSDGTDAGEDIATDVGQGWCGATLEAADGGVAAEGFDATPEEALAAVAGTYAGALDDGTTFTWAVEEAGDPVLVRARRYAADEVAAEGVDVLELGPCVDHYRLPVEVDVDAGAVLGLWLAADLVYTRAGEALDGTGSDTAMVAGSSTSWEGTAQPSWGADADVSELHVFGYWAAGVWQVDLSFWGEGTTGSGPDAAAWAGEEPLCTSAEATPAG